MNSADEPGESGESMLGLAERSRSGGRRRRLRSGRQADVVRLVNGSASSTEAEAALAEHRHGRVPGFLTGAGLAAGRIEALRARLCTT